MQQFIIGPNEDNRRLDKYLLLLMPNATTSLIYKMLRKKNITVNKKKVEGNYKLNAGDSVEMFFAEETFAKLSGNEKTDINNIVNEYQSAYEKIGMLNIVYEDDDFIFVDKPVGILSQKADNDDYSMNEWLIGYLLDNGSISAELLKTFKPAFCNRLDRNTTGLILGGKTLKALSTLSELLRDRSLHKFYLTTLEGNPDKRLPVNTDEFIDLYAYIDKNEKNNKVIVYSVNDKNRPESAKKIHTGCRLVEIYDNKMLVEIDLHTGKSHQIRAHMAFLGHPIVGDPKYNKSKKGTFQALRAYRVVFPVIDEFPLISGKEFTC